MNQTTNPDIDRERIRSTELITLNRPEVFNAITQQAAVELGEMMRAAASDRTCRAIVLTGTGRGFCAGIDVKAVAGRDAVADRGESAAGVDPFMASFEGLHYRLSSVIRTVHSLPIPVISAVNGHAIGAGFALAAASDLRIGSPDAKFADGFVKRGISGCELGLSYFLPKVVGSAKAFDWMTTGRRVDADEALAAGLISQIVDAENLVDEALRLGDAIAANAPAAVSMTKEVMWANVHATSLDQALALESRTQSLVRNTADAREAREAFIEKREPEFRTPQGSRPLR
ncbi:MAG: enoyl-CoA hydratase/isomerase family protein [Acidimicrobiales bacterium]|jgi:enoyl-CoA hydratase